MSRACDVLLTRNTLLNYLQHDIYHSPKALLHRENIIRTRDGTNPINERNSALGIECEYFRHQIVCNIDSTGSIKQ